MNSNCLLLLNGLKGHFGLERLVDGCFEPQNLEDGDIYIDFHLYNPAVKTHLSTNAYNLRKILRVAPETLFVVSSC